MHNPLSLKPRWLISIIPYKLVMAIMSTLIILYVIDVGGRAEEVSLTVATLTLGGLIGSLLWSYLINRAKNKLGFYLLGYLGLIFPSLILYFSQDFLLILISAFFFSFVTASTYFAGLFMISKTKKGMDKMIGRFEEVGGWAWVAGLVLGTLLTSFLNLRTIFLILGILSLLSILLIVPSLERKLLVKFKEKIKEEELGLLPMVERGVEFILKEEEFVVHHFFRGLGAVVKGPLSLTHPIVKIGLPKTHIYFHLSFLLLFISFGLVSSQIINFQKQNGLSDSLVFMFSLLSSVVAAIFYSKASKTKNLEKTLKCMYALRGLMFLVVGIPFLLFYPFIYFLFFTFFLVDGFTWAHILILSNSNILRVAKGEIGLNNFFRSIGFIIGSFLAGIVVSSLGFFTNFLMASIIVFMVALIFKKMG